MAANYDDRDREVTFEIVEEIGIIASAPTGWTKELNVVAWNGGQAKYDIREWSPHHDRMSRGITLNEQEMRMIVELLKRRARVRSVPRRANIAQSDSAGGQDEQRVPEREEQREPDREEPAFAKGEEEAVPKADEPAFADTDENEVTDEQDEDMPF